MTPPLLRLKASGIGESLLRGGGEGAEIAAPLEVTPACQSRSTPPGGGDPLPACLALASPVRRRRARLREACSICVALVGH